jgi:hypothetical protein
LGDPSTTTLRKGTKELGGYWLGEIQFFSELWQILGEILFE